MHVYERERELKMEEEERKYLEGVDKDEGGRERADGDKRKVQSKVEHVEEEKE